MIVYIVVDFVVGLLAHQLRPFTLDFAGRLGDIIRDTIGLGVFIPLAAWRLLARRDNMTTARTQSKWIEIVATEMAMTAGALGAGVIVGMLLDQEKE
uniref:Holin n=1 Tax=viral metagenome TaxID=1070528 RepID=A0A6M3LA19_9ZZZZ